LGRGDQASNSTPAFDLTTGAIRRAAAGSSGTCSCRLPAAAEQTRLWLCPSRRAGKRRSLSAWSAPSCRLGV